MTDRPAGGGLSLPPFYKFEYSEPDAPRLIRPNGTTVARFGPGWTDAAVEAAVRTDEAQIDAAISNLEELRRKSDRDERRRG
jgi:hypothetical protein